MRQRLESLRATIDSLAGMTVGATKLDAVTLRDAVGDALGLPALEGDPTALRNRAAAYTNAATDTTTVSGDVGLVAIRSIPDVWEGAASDKASAAVFALAVHLDATVITFRRAAQVLDDLADRIEKAQRLHGHGVNSLWRASALLDQITVTLPLGVALPNLVSWDDHTMDQAINLAKHGVHDLLAAVAAAEHAGHTATGGLTKLAPAAHLTNSDSRSQSIERLRNVDFTDKKVFADVASELAYEENVMLTDNVRARAAQFFDGLSLADRDAFDHLLAGCRSFQEGAYLLQAVAAGHTVTEITQFDALIHPHGNDPTWLANHLTPSHTKNEELGARDAVSYAGEPWTQGDRPTCVAMSMVVARAMVDPLYTLQLTTGGHPDNPAYDNTHAFSQRLQDETSRVYGGRGDRSDDGMSEQDGQQAANDEIGPYTGHQYQIHDLYTDADRGDVLPLIEKAVDEGRPVPVSIRGLGGGHVMLIIGHHGDKLQIYNPWGYTTWITTDDFVHDNMGAALGETSVNMPTAVHALLPE